MRRPLSLAIVAAAALAAADAAAEDEGDDVLVRGERPGGFTSEAKLESSRREITDAASLVEPLPGVHVRRLGADDSFATLSVRGTSSTQVAVYLAGVPLTGGADPTLDLATLPLWPGARARVYRSFAPASLGRGSLGGTLVLSPPSPRDPPKTDVWAAAASFGQRRVRVGDIRGDEDGVRVATGISASRSDDDFSYLDPLKTQPGGADVFSTRDNAGHAAASALASVGVPVRVGGGAPGALSVTALAQARKQELAGPLGAPTPDQRLDSSRVVSAVELTLPSRAGTVGVRAWGRREGLSIRDRFVSAIVTQGPTSTDDAILAAGGSAGLRGRPFERATLEVRLDGSAERFAPGTWLGAAQPPAARRTNGGAAIDATLRATDRVLVTASARGDAWVDTSADGPARTTARPTGNLGAEVGLGAVTLASHAGFVARPPSFVERYGNRGSFLANADLATESAFTADAGGRFGRRLGPVRLELEAAAFGTWAEDLITFVNQGAYGRARAENIGLARLFGLEGVARVALFGVELRASHTALATANASECRFVGGACERPALPGRPEHDLVADLTWERGPLRLRYGVDVVTGIKADRAGNIVVPDRVLHGLGARLDVREVPGLSVALDVRNLFDLRVAEYAGLEGIAGGAAVRAPVGDVFQYPLPGRRLLVSVRWTSSEPRR